MSRPNLAEQFKKMQEHHLDLESSNKDLEENLNAKRVTLWSAVVIQNEEPSHRTGKEPVDQEPRIKKSWKHAKDRYERDEENMDIERNYEMSREKSHDRYQPSAEKNRFQTQKSLKEDSENRDSTRTNETDFKRLERMIEEVALSRKDLTA